MTKVKIKSKFKDEKTVKTLGESLKKKTETTEKEIVVTIKLPGEKKESHLADKAIIVAILNNDGKNYIDVSCIVDNRQEIISILAIAAEGLMKVIQTHNSRNY